MLALEPDYAAASSMIAVGLDWKFAIGACVLGNTVMGLVITINGRVGAKVCSDASIPCSTKLTGPSYTPHSRSWHACRSDTTSATSSSCPDVFSPLSG